MVDLNLLNYDMTSHTHQNLVPHALQPQEGEQRLNNFENAHPYIANTVKTCAVLTYTATAYTLGRLFTINPVGYALAATIRHVADKARVHYCPALTLKDNDSFLKKCGKVAIMKLAPTVIATGVVNAAGFQVQLLPTLALSYAATVVTPIAFCISMAGIGLAVYGAISAVQYFRPDFRPASYEPPEML